MKTGTALLLIFALWFGWARYAEHEAARQKDAAERTAITRAHEQDEIEFRRLVDRWREEGSRAKRECLDRNPQHQEACK
jgi:hypothetical protein